MRCLLIGNRGGTNIAGRLEVAALALGFDVQVLESQEAMKAPLWLRRFNWWVRGRRPSRLEFFSRCVVEECRRVRPTVLIAAGIAPLTKSALTELGQCGVFTLNYLTDDAWNPVHRASWFLKALPNYDCVLSPRRANIPDLERLACRRVHYLPFAYAPELHFPDRSATRDEQKRFAADVVFAGGADREREPYVQSLTRAGLDVAVYGDYWERFRETRAYARGHANPSTLRKATAAAKIALCLVRRANRDGHCMRTYEVPAIGACMLTEDTAEHREIFGDEGRAVFYFRTPKEMISKARWLLDHDDERRRVALAAHTLIVNGRNTYKDRLISMLELAGVSVPLPAICAV